MIVLAAHGTRDPAGAVVVAELAGLVRSRGVPVRVAYADVREPDVTTVLDSLGGRPAVVVPAFLAAGYHVRADIPAQVAASGHPAVTVAAPSAPPPNCSTWRASGCGPPGTARATPCCWPRRDRATTARWPTSAAPRGRWRRGWRPRCGSVRGHREPDGG